MEVKKQKVKESTLRKKYKDYVAIYKENISLVKEKIEGIENEFENEFRKNKFWKLFHITNIPVFLALDVLSLLLQSFDFVRTLCILLTLISIICLLNNKRIKKKIINDMNEKKIDIRVRYYEKANKALDDASKLVLPLMVEFEYKAKLEKYKESHSYEEFKACYIALIKRMRNSIKDEEAKKDSYQLILYYDRWYADKIGEHNDEVSHDERLAIAEAKARLYYRT